MTYNSESPDNWWPFIWVRIHEVAPKRLLTLNLEPFHCKYNQQPTTFLLWGGVNHYNLYFMFTEMLSPMIMITIIEVILLLVFWLLTDVTAAGRRTSHKVEHQCLQKVFLLLLLFGATEENTFCFIYDVAQLKTIYLIHTIVFHQLHFGNIGRVWCKCVTGHHDCWHRDTPPPPLQQLAY